MIVSYALTARTSDDRPIRGHVMFHSAPNLSGGVSYNAAACQIACDDDLICECGKAGMVGFLDGPAPGQVLTTGADWVLGPWANQGTGAWFHAADGSRYPEATPGFGDKGDYDSLPPRMELCADLAEQGPFHAVGTIVLTLED